MKISVAQLGARAHYAVPRILYQAGMLDHLFTDSYAGNKPFISAFLRAIPASFRPKSVERWLSRSSNYLPSDRITAFDVYSGLYRLAQSWSASSYDKAAVYAKYGQKFNNLIERRLSENTDAVFGFSGASATLFKVAKKRGALCILDQISATRSARRRLIAEEYLRAPEWFADAPEVYHGIKDDPLEREEAESIHLADLILVASGYTRRTLLDVGYSRVKTVEVPKGVDHSRFKPRCLAGHPQCSRLRVLYAGTISPTKGAHYFLEAVRMLKTHAVDFQLAGPVRLSTKMMGPFESWAEFLGPVPRGHMPQLFREADIFVFPTLSDGFGFVQVEALASGLPVIATRNCGSVVRDNIEGNIVPLRDSEAIAACIDQYACDRHVLAEKRAAALCRARDFTLEAYADRLLNALLLLSKRAASPSCPQSSS